MTSLPFIRVLVLDSSKFPSCPVTTSPTGFPFQTFEKDILTYFCTLLPTKSFSRNYVPTFCILNIHQITNSSLNPQLLILRLSLNKCVVEQTCRLYSLRMFVAPLRVFSSFFTSPLSSVPFYLFLFHQYSDVGVRFTLYS